MLPVGLDARHRTNVGPYMSFPILCDLGGSSAGFCWPSACKHMNRSHRLRRKPRKSCTDPSSSGIGDQTISVAFAGAEIDHNTILRLLFVIAFGSQKQLHEQATSHNIGEILCGHGSFDIGGQGMSAISFRKLRLKSAIIPIGLGPTLTAQPPSPPHLPSSG